MARGYVMGSFIEQEVIMSLQMQASGERKVLNSTLMSGMLVAAAKNKLMPKGGL